nr:hypothetical protein [Tanacetum cinerariifolium]
YESDKLILDTYGDTVTIKRRRDDPDEDEEPSAGSNQGSKRRRVRKEPESTSAPKEKTFMSTEKSTDGSKSHHKSASKFAPAEEPMHTAEDLEEPTHQEFITAMTNMHSGESRIGGENVNSSMDLLLTGNLLEMSTPNVIAVTELQIVECHNYKHLDWITVRRDDEKLYKFKESDFNRLRIQDIEDMLLLIVQGKLTNLTVAEQLDFNVSLRMFTRSVVIQRRVEDLQLGVESYQNKINLTKPNMYRSDLKRNEAYTAYSNHRGFIYQNKDKKNRLMRIDELHKFIDGTLNDVRTALDDRLKGIWTQYLLRTIWGRSDKDKAGAMIQAIDKQLRSLDKFVGGRLYEGDLRECNGIPKRTTMYLNLWRYKVVRHKYLNLMIQPEPDGSTRDIPLDSVEVLRHDVKRSKKRFYTSAENLVNEILLKLNLPDHRILKDGCEGTCFQLSQRFIVACSYPTNNYKDIMKAQVHVSRLPLL